MKYYSEKTKKFYDTEIACKEAETDYEVEMIERKRKATEEALKRKEAAAKAEAERKAKLEEKHTRQQEVLDAYHHYHKLAEAYARDYDEHNVSYLFDQLLDFIM